MSESDLNFFKISLFLLVKRQIQKMLHLILFFVIPIEFYNEL